MNCYANNTFLQIINSFLNFDYQGTKAIQAMDIRGGYSLGERGTTWNPDAFLKMYNLKFLKVNFNKHVPTHLPDDLRILDWIFYPSKSLASSFQLDELVQLCLQHSKIEQLRIGIKVSVFLSILLQLCF